MDSDAREPALLRRIEELAARAAEEDQAPPEGPVLAAALTGLRAELGGLRAELGTLRADVTAVRSGVEASGTRLANAVTAGRTETEELSRRHDDLGGKVDELAEVLADVRTVLPELRSALNEQPGAAGAVRASLTRLDESLDTRLDELGADLHRTLSAGLTQASAGTRAAENVWSEATSAVEARLAAVEDTLDGLAERLESLTRDGIGTATDHIIRVEHKLDQVVATTLREATDAQAQWAEDIRAALSDVAGALDRSLGALAESMHAGREAETTRVETVVGQLSGALDEAVAELDERIAVARESNAAATADVRGFLEAFQTTTEQRLEEMRAALDDGLAQAREALVAEITPTIASLETANSAATRVVEEEVTTLRTDLADALEEVRDRIATTVTRAEEGITTAVEEQRSSFDDVVRSLRSDVLDRVEESTAAVRTGLDELRNDVTSAARSGEQTTARLQTFGQTLDEAADAVAEMHADWDRRTDAAIDLVTQAGHATVDEFRAEVRRVVDGLRGSVEASTSVVSTSGDVVSAATARLVAAGEALLGYLGRRDLVLEQERDRVLHELLDEFAAGLSAKERKSMGDRVGAALDRRRDARDAERHRRQAHGEPPIELPSVPEDLSALAGPLPKPARPTPATRPVPGPAATSPPAKEPAKKAAKKVAKEAAKKVAKEAAKKAAKKAAVSPAPGKQAAATPPAKTPGATETSATETPAAAKTAAKKAPKKAAKAAAKKTAAQKTAAKKTAAKKTGTAAVDEPPGAEPSAPAAAQTPAETGSEAADGAGRAPTAAVDSGGDEQIRPD